MTVYLFSGTPGSGKSAHQAMIIYYAIKTHKPVIANFDIDRKAFKDSSSFFYVDNVYMSPTTLMKFAEIWFKNNKFHEGAIKVFIDEAQIMFSNRDWKNNAEWIKFFTQHRKLGMDVYLVAQNHEMIDKHIRSLVEYEVHHRKVNNVGWFGKLVSVICLGHPVFVAVTKWYGQRMRLGAEWFLGRKKFFNLYNTYKLFDNSQLD